MWAEFLIIGWSLSEWWSWYSHNNGLISERVTVGRPTLPRVSPTLSVGICPSAHMVQSNRQEKGKENWRGCIKKPEGWCTSVHLYRFFCPAGKKAASVHGGGYHRPFSLFERHLVEVRWVVVCWKPGCFNYREWDLNYIEVGVIDISLCLKGIW